QVPGSRPRRPRVAARVPGAGRGGAGYRRASGAAGRAGADRRAAVDADVFLEPGNPALPARARRPRRGGAATAGTIAAAGDRRGGRGWDRGVGVREVGAGSGASGAAATHFPCAALTESLALSPFS